MKPIENRKHHYVPQCLLRNFTSGGRESLFAFDKWEGKQFGVAVEDAAAERGYNTFDTAEASGCAEDFFTAIESSASPVLKEIVSARKLPVLSLSDRAALIRFSIAQMLRSKNHRAIFGQLGALMREIADREGSPELKAWIQPYDPALEKQSLLGNLERDLSYLTPALVDKDLVLFTTDLSVPLFIGDSPLVRTNTINISDFHGTNGLDSPGVEVYLPLSSTLALGFMCPTIGLKLEQQVRVFGHKASPTTFDYLLAVKMRRPLSLAALNITYMNSCQIIAAERFVYSCSDDFTLVREMLLSDSLLRRGGRLTNNQDLGNRI